MRLIQFEEVININVTHNSDPMPELGGMVWINPDKVTAVVEGVGHYVKHPYCSVIVCGTECFWVNRGAMRAALILLEAEGLKP